MLVHIKDLVSSISFFWGYFGPIFELCRGKMALSVAADFSYRPLDDRNGQLATEIKLNQI